MTARSEGRAVALDLGERRIGVAVCDSNRTVATPYTTVSRVGDRTAEHERIESIVAEVEATTIVVGLPLSLDGEEGPAARKVLSEVKALRKRFGSSGVAVVTHDERHSTTTASQSLHAGGVGARKGREVVDQLAASVILQSWIESQAGNCGHD